MFDVATSEHDKTGTGMPISFDKENLFNSNVIVDVILPYIG